MQYIGAIAIGCIMVLQPACLFRGRSKAKAPPAPAPAVRIALLPFNIPAENTNLRWISLAAPLVMAKTIENSPSFDVVPVWQAYPVAIESLGAGRSMTPEIAAYVADRVGAKWATNGELAPAKDGVWMRVDFIPAKSTLVPYRYEKTLRLDAMGLNAHAALSQFANYLVLRPLPKPTGKTVGASAMRELAEALDREYGWFVNAEPGKSEKLASSLAKTDTQLARLLFDPILYPVVGSMAAKPKPVELKPAPAPSQDKPEAGETGRPGQPSQTPPQPSQAPPPVPQAPPPAVETPAPTPQAPPATAQNTQPAAAEVKTSPKPETTPAQSAPSSTPAPSIPQPGPPRKARPSNPPAFQSGIPTTETRAEEPAPAAAAKEAAHSTGTGTFQIQVYSTQSKADADAKSATLAKAGYLPKVDQVDLKEKGVWFRIRLQGFKSREQAKAAGEKLVAEKVIQQYWIVP